MPTATVHGRKPSPTSAAATSGSAPGARSRVAAEERRHGVPARDWASQVGTVPEVPASSTRDGPHDARRGGPLRGGCDRHDAPRGHREAAPRMASKADSKPVKPMRGKARSRVHGKADLPGNPHCPSGSQPRARLADPDGILPSGSDAARAAATESAAPRLAGPRTSRRTSARGSTGAAVEAVPGWSAPAAGKRARGCGVRATALEPVPGSEPGDAQATGDGPVGPASCAAGPPQQREPHWDGWGLWHQDAQEPVRNRADAPPCPPCAPAPGRCHPPGTPSDDDDRPSSAGRYPARRSHPPARTPGPTRQSTGPGRPPRTRSVAPR